MMSGETLDGGKEMRSANPSLKTWHACMHDYHCPENNGIPQGRREDDDKLATNCIEA